MRSTRTLPGLAGAIVVVVMLLIAAPTHVPAQPATALLGNWAGSWVSDQNPSLRGAVGLVIMRVDGSAVNGRVEVTGPRMLLLDFQGTFEANRLSFAVPERQLRAEYDLFGIELRGKHYGPDGTLSLTLRRR